jgi:hypothetical protein
MRRKIKCNAVRKYLLLILVIIVGTMNSNVSLAQGFSTTVKVIVTRTDNGRRVPGAEMQFFGQTYSGVYRTNEQGEINLSRPASIHNSREAILYCWANGYYPAMRFDFGPSSSGKAHVHDFLLTPSDPNEFITISLEPKSRSDLAPAKPTLIGTSYYNQISRSEILFKWNSVNGAYTYEIQWANNENFYSPQSFNQVLHVNNGEYQDHVLKLGRGTYYWRVRAHDGYQYGEWSDFKKVSL